MALPLRFAYKGALYHIRIRGNERNTIYFTDADYQKFKAYIAQAIEKYHCLVHCYILMNNHVHLVIETPESNIGASYRTGKAGKIVTTDLIFGMVSKQRNRAMQLYQDYVERLKTDKELRKEVEKIDAAMSCVKY